MATGAANRSENDAATIPGVPRTGGTGFASEKRIEWGVGASERAQIGEVSPMEQLLLVYYRITRQPRIRRHGRRWGNCWMQVQGGWDA